MLIRRPWFSDHCINLRVAMRCYNNSTDRLCWPVYGVQLDNIIYHHQIHQCCSPRDALFQEDTALLVEVLMQLAHIAFHFATFYLFFCRGSTPPVQPCPALCHQRQRQSAHTHQSFARPVLAWPVAFESCCCRCWIPAPSSPRLATRIFWLAPSQFCSILSPVPSNRLPSILAHVNNVEIGKR